MNGTKLPKTVVELTKEKPEVILFVDGDRGGNLIIKNVIENAKIDFITMAPEGKEVEELTGKEILQALRKKTPVSEYSANGRGRGVKRYDSEPNSEKPKKEIQKLTDKEKEKIKDEVNELVGTKGAIIFNKDLEKVRKVPVGRLSVLELDEEPYVIAIDGTATPRVVENCERLGCQTLIAKTFVDTDTSVNLVSL